MSTALEFSENKIATPANIVTIIRICLIPFFVVALLSPWPSWIGLDDIINNHTKALIACAIFVIISLTDMLDGYLARSRNEVTTFGKFMDPLADKMLVIAALLSLVELDIIPSWPVIIIIAREFIVSGFRMLAANQGVVVAANWLGKTKTLFQVLAIILFLLKEGISIYSTDNPFSNPLYLLSWSFMIVALIFTIISMFDYLKNFPKLMQNSLDEQIENSAKKLIDKLIEYDKKVIVAESLTGGMISAALTSIPGSSAVVLGGVASYAYELKRDCLKVDYDYLEKYGAVNEHVATQMAKGALSLSIADYSLSVTGIAGPTGEEEGKPVGTVYSSIQSRSGFSQCKRLNFSGNRNEIRKKTTFVSLNMLLDVIQNDN